MNNRQYNFFTYLSLGFMMIIYVISLSSVVGSLSAKHPDPYRKSIAVHTVDCSGIVPDGYFNSHYDQPGNPVDAPEPTELEQDYDFATLFAFAPLRTPIQYPLTENLPFGPEHNPAHVLEISAPPPQLIAYA